MKGLSLTRIAAVMVKEFTQLRRDRITYAMILVLPLMQLLLFGYAINTDPRHLPAAVVSHDHGRIAAPAAAERDQPADVVAARRALAGHGVGNVVHAEPQVPFGREAGRRVDHVLRRKQGRDMRWPVSRDRAFER